MILYVSVSTLIDWDGCFDQKNRLIRTPDNRGKTTKVTPELVRQIVDKAIFIKEQNKKIQIKQFTKELLREKIDLSPKIVKEILIANDLFEARTKIKRPHFYQSLCQRIPNGLLSTDGSEFTVWLDDKPFIFNVELAVDVGSFAHTAYSIGESETASAVLTVLERHRRKWGDPIGVLSDHGSANMSNEIGEYLDKRGILQVPAGPANPKGNGTDEGAFSLMKKVLGTIRLDLSSPKSMANSFLDALISVYIQMRNKIPLNRKIIVPDDHMKTTVSEEQKANERQRLIDHKKSRSKNESDKLKLDKLTWIINFHKLNVEPEALKQAMRTIRYYENGAIIKAEEAFLKAINRRPEVKKLPYFFGILKNIQQERDDETYRQYCREQYNHKLLSELRDQEKPKSEKPVEIESIINILVKSLDYKVKFIKDFAIRRAQKYVYKLMESCRYQGPLKKKFLDVL
ncbi:MAG: transposase family protein, partial [Deltaproteobacteria bacterium]|nr:transposase family protein [Deltaproteobacteria bacterium]